MHYGLQPIRERRLHASGPKRLTIAFVARSSLHGMHQQGIADWNTLRTSCLAEGLNGKGWAHALVSS
jgi:hypothetical protein